MNHMQYIYQIPINSSPQNTSMDFTSLKTELDNISFNNTQSFQKITHAHIRGSRHSIQFEHKQNYTINDVINIINRIDDAWESNINHDENEMQYVQ